MAGERWVAVDVSELARGVVENARADERWKEVRFLFEGAQGAQVLGVAGGLETAIRNLVLNAASFNIAGGDVTVSIEVGDEHVVVAVRDTGPGIAAEDLPKVFDRFFTTRGGQKKGTGLGLALVRAVAEAHRGTATVDSVEGSWTRFELRLFRQLPSG